MIVSDKYFLILRFTTLCKSKPCTVTNCMNQTVNGIGEDF